MKKLHLGLLLFALSTLPTFALAAGAAGGHGGGIPVTQLIYQVINFVLFAALLFFILRNKVGAYFKGRESEFKQALIKAEAAKREAEAKRNEIQERLNKLEASSQESINQARAEAEALKNKIMAEARQLATHLREEAARAANLEIDRAKTELREELLNQSVALSRKILAEKMVDNDQKRLQTEFVDKIQVVR